MHTLFDGEFQFALLLDEFGLCLLRLGQFLITDFEHFMQLGQLTRLSVQFGGAGKFGLLCFFGNDARPLGV